MEMPTGPICQSCGMPLIRDAKGGGTNADGSLTQEYCSHCYENGAFIHPELTASCMQELVQGKLMEMHIPEAQAVKMAEGIPQLKRWQN